MKFEDLREALPPLLLRNPLAKYTFRTPSLSSFQFVAKIENILPELPNPTKASQNRLNKTQVVSG